MSNWLSGRIWFVGPLALSLVASCSVAPKPQSKLSDETFSLQKSIDEMLYEKVGAPVNYEKAGISFSYPSNWKIGSDEELKKGIRQIYIAGNNMGSVSISVASPGLEFNQKKIIEEMETGLINAISKNGKIIKLETNKVTRQISGQEIKGTQQTFGGNIAGEKTMRNVEYFFFDKLKYKVMVVFNTGFGELKRPGNGFQIIMDSLKFD
jgi:hypothetical protein